MGKVASFDIEGIYCWFNSQEHRPPHFHAKRRGKWHFRVWLLKSEGAMLERAKGPQGHISAQDKKLLLRKTVCYRAELLQEWEQKVKYDN